MPRTHPTTPSIRAQPDADGWYSIQGEPTPECIRELATVGHLERLSVTKARLITAKLARRLAGLSVGRLWLWCTTTRTALRHILAIRGLHTLDVLNLQHPGQLAGFEHATLHTLRANFGLNEADLIAIARCTSLRELGIQNAELTPRALTALCEQPNLTALDLEGSPFNDDMAAYLAGRLKLRSLDLGATPTTRRGLRHLVTMTSLQSIDLWATAINEDDLHLLRELPALEYVSLGGCADCPTLDASRMIPILLSLPALKRVWLDGIRLSPKQRAHLTERLELVRT